MELKDLKASITEIPTDELMALIKDIRQSRRTPKRIHADQKPRASAKAPTSKLTLEQLMATMNPAELLAILQGKGK